MWHFVAESSQPLFLNFMAKVLGIDLGTTILHVRNGGGETSGARKFRRQRTTPSVVALPNLAALGWRRRQAQAVTNPQYNLLDQTLMGRQFDKSEEIKRVPTKSCAREWRRRRGSRCEGKPNNSARPNFGHTWQTQVGR